MLLCASGEPQSRHHLFIRCRAWATQAKKMWKEIGKACERKHSHTPSFRLLWDGRATEAVLEFLRTTRVGCIGTERDPPEEEEGRIVRKRREGWAHPRLYLFPSSFLYWSFLFGANFSGASFLCSFLCLSFGVLGSPTMTG